MQTFGRCEESILVTGALAGDKAQVGLVCLASDEQVVRLQNQLKGSVTTPALKIFGSRDLERFLEGDIAEFSRWLGG